MKSGLYLALAMVVFVLPLPGQDINVVSESQPIKIYVQKEVTIEYRLVTKEEPLAFQVEGPAYLRIYSRYLSKEPLKGEQVYKYILQEDETKERIVSHTTMPSSKSRAEDRYVTKWRSTYLEVPPGTHTYRIILWEAQSGEIACKVKHSVPMEWTDVVPLGTPEEAIIAEDEKLVTYYIVDRDNPLKVKVTGETRLKFMVRLNFDDSMADEASFTLAVFDDGALREKKSLKTYRSETARYRNLPSLTPSKAETEYVDVPEGEHTYEFKLEGTLAKSASLRFLIPKK